MAVEITKAYLITELSDFCRVTEHLAQSREPWGEPERVEENKKKQERWFIRRRGTPPSPYGTKVLNVRAGEKINACSLMS